MFSSFYLCWLYCIDKFFLYQKYILYFTASLRSVTVSEHDVMTKGPRISAIYLPNGDARPSSNPPSHVGKIEDVYTSPKVILSGPGLRKAYVNKVAYFSLDGRAAPPGRIYVYNNVKGPSIRDVLPLGKADNCHKLSSVYSLHILYALRAFTILCVSQSQGQHCFSQSFLRTPPPPPP